MPNPQSLNLNPIILLRRTEIISDFSTEVRQELPAEIEEYEAAKSKWLEYQQLPESERAQRVLQQELHEEAYKEWCLKKSQPDTNPGPAPAAPPEVPKDPGPYFKSATVQEASKKHLSWVNLCMCPDKVTDQIIQILAKAEHDKANYDLDTGNVKNNQTMSSSAASALSSSPASALFVVGLTTLVGGALVLTA